MKDLVGIQTRLLFEQLKANARNPLNRFGYKCYSQNDEDGLIAEIFWRVLEGRPGKFIEFGVENGLECNTLSLLFQGWHGWWVGDGELAFSIPERGPLRYLRGFVSLENIDEVCGVVETLGEIDFLSMDVDGNDFWFVERLLCLHPKVICVEYNGAIAVPGRFRMPYDAQHRWTADDYYGASLQAWDDLLRNYRYVVCNLSGVNAFFVRSDFFERFGDVPERLGDVFVPAQYFFLPSGHRVSPKTIASKLLE